MSMADMFYDIGVDNYMHGDDYLYRRTSAHKRTKSVSNKTRESFTGVILGGRHYWRMKGGKVIAVDEMTDTHLINTIAMLRRQIDGSAHDDFCWDNINAMEQELRKRGVKFGKD